MCTHQYVVLHYQYTQTPAGSVTGCSLSSPACDGQMKCDLTNAIASSPAGVCRAVAPCPACAAGFECYRPSAWALPFCRRRATCSPACAANAACAFDEEYYAYLAYYASSGTCLDSECSMDTDCPGVGQACMATPSQMRRNPLRRSVQPRQDLQPGDQKVRV